MEAAMGTHVDSPTLEMLPAQTTSSQPPPQLKTIVTSGRVPVDEHFEFKTTHEVFSEDGITYDFLLVRVDIESNKNWYRIGQVLQPESEHGRWVTISRYGYVGHPGVTTRYFWPNEKEAIDAFDRLFKLWTGARWCNRRLVGKPGKGRHTYIPRRYPYLPESYALDETIESRLDERLQRLGELIFAYPVSSKEFRDAQKLYEVTYDVGKLPLGPISLDTLDDASAVLCQIDCLLDSTEVGQEQKKALIDQTSRYYTLVPHPFPRNEGVPVIDTRARLRQEQQLLQDIKTIITSLHYTPRSVSQTDPYQNCKLDRLIGSLALKVLEPVSKSSTEYKKVEKYCVNTQSTSEANIFTVTDVIRVEREGEAANFEELCEGRPDNRWLFWHGSINKNFAGILSKGLRAKEKPAGDTYGRGIYLANTSLIASLYCRNKTGAGSHLLTLCEVQLGDVLNLKSYDNDGDKTAANLGKHSCRGMGQWSPTGSEDAGEALGRPDLKGVKMPSGKITTYNGADNPKHYDEFVVFKPEQVRIRYVVSIEFAGN